MKSKFRFFLFIVLLLVLAFSACAKPVEEAEPTVTPTSRPKITPSPKKTPSYNPGDAYGYVNEFVKCQIDNTRNDTKQTWKVYMPTESPDPSWTIESVDGDTVTYSKITCNHETPIPEGTADIEVADDVTEVTPTPEG